MADSLHFHLIDAVATALNETFAEGRYADKVIERLFKKNLFDLGVIPQLLKSSTIITFLRFE